MKFTRIWSGAFVMVIGMLVGSVFFSAPIVAQTIDASAQELADTYAPIANHAISAAKAISPRRSIGSSTIPPSRYVPMLESQ